MCERAGNVEVEIIEAVVPNMDLRTPNLNNSFAYAASLANVRLDEAEVAIDEALKLGGENEAYLDTKAWVLHKQMRCAHLCIRSRMCSKLLCRSTSRS